MQGPALRLETLSDDDLLARLADLVSCSRRVEAELIWHLAEMDARRLYLREACPSMHVYATTRLHLSDAEAYLRITVARVSRRFPVVLAMLADGRLSLSAIVKLAPHLRARDGEALLARAVHKSKREIEILVAELAPRPDVPSLMRRLPARPDRTMAVGASPLVLGGVQNREVRDGDRSALVVDQMAPPATSTPPLTASAAPLTASAAPLGAAVTPVATPVSPIATPPAAPAVLAPIAPARYKVQFTATSELHDKITHAQTLLRHQIPDGDLAAVFDRAMTLLLRELERARFAATSNPRKTASDADPTPSSRRIPDPIRRAVWTRDGGQCTFRDRQGRRCPARERLEFHHIVPFGQGGDHGEGNVTLRCLGHNMFQAELDYGAAFMTARRRGAVVSRRKLDDGAPPS